MLLRATLSYLPAQIVGPLAQFLAAVVWTHLLAPPALGAYAIVWAVQELVLLVALSWWSSYTLRYFGDHAAPDERAAFDRVELAVHLAAAVVQAVVAIAVLVLVLDTPPTFALIAATLAFTLTRNLTTHVGDRARASFKLGYYTVLTTAGPVGGLVLGVLVAVTISATAEALLWSYALAQLVGLAIALPAVGPRLARPSMRGDILISAWAYGAPLVIGNTLTWAATHGIRFIVEFEAGAAAVGLVTVGWWLGLRATTFAGLLVTGASFSLAVERIRKEGHAAGREVMAANGALLLLVLAPTTVGGLMLSGPLVELLVAAPFREVTAQILPLALLAGALRIFRMHATDQTFLLFERPAYDIWISALDAVSTLILCWLGYRYGGLNGAVLGCVIAAALTSGASLLLAHLAFGFRLRGMDLLRILAGLAAMAGIIMLLRFEATRYGLLLEIVLSGSAYLLVLAALHPATWRRLMPRLARR